MFIIIVIIQSKVKTMSYYLLHFSTHTGKYHWKTYYITSISRIKSYCVILKLHTKFCFQVCNEQKSETGVFFLSVNILDRYLSKEKIDKSVLQLLGAVCMFIASKVTEVDPLDPLKLVIYTENSITVHEIMVLVHINYFLWFAISEL